MNFWEDKVWHRAVHERLGEALFYYLARVRPFDPQTVIENLKRLLVEKRLGSVRVFVIFGPYDLLIRAWLHPSVAKDFPSWLDVALETCRSLHPFAVTHIDKRSYYQLDQDAYINRDLLESLDEDQINAVQQGHNPAVLQRLIDAQLVINRSPTLQEPTIRFFIAINLEEVTNAIQAEVVSNIKRYLLKQENILHTSIYVSVS